MDFINKKLNKIIYIFIFYLIIFYQKIISPVLPARCRYYPTCSAYGMQAIKWHGGAYGTLLLLKRLARCQPFGGHGIDFVPLPLYRCRYFFIAEQTQSYTQSYPQHHCIFIDHYSYRRCLVRWLRER